MRRLAFALFFLGLCACPYRANTPSFALEDARAGRFTSGPAPSKAALCKHWSTVNAGDEWAIVHTSFPETDPDGACFTPVTHRGRALTFPPAPRGCAFPAETIPAIDPAALLPCSPPDRDRVIAHNRRVLDRVRATRATHPYAAVVIAGEGWADQADLLVHWAPDDACTDLGDVAALRSMPARAARGADALRADLAPIAIVTGGAVHSRLVEAYALLHILACREKIDPDRVLLEPCAEHTHTNLRNAARWIDALHARAAYLVTNDSLQADYFQDASVFDFIFGTIDQRSLRDWGYVIGSWHQASIGNRGGFWFTPYRFWAEPREELGSVTCATE